MTDPDWSPEDERIGRALKARAADAPRSEDLAWDLAATARRRVRRRRNMTMGAAAALVAVIGFGGVWSLAGPETFTATSGNDNAGSGEVASAPERAAGTPPAKPSTPQNKVGQSDSAGWRWESFGGVEVEVPARWGYGVSGEPWCIDNRGQVDGAVGRPGAVRGIKCPDAIPADQLGQHVWFSRTPEVAAEDLGGGWRRDTKVVGHVTVEVQTRDPALHERILGSIRQVGTTDSQGCPVRHPIATDQQRYDVPAGRGLSWDAVVTGLAACRYETGQISPLVGSLRFTADDATEILAAIRKQPGSNPALRVPGMRCMPDSAPPAEAIVLLFDTPAGQREIRVGYDACAGVGFFNGGGTRGLFAEPLRLFAIGGVRPVNGSALGMLSGW